MTPDERVELAERAAKAAADGRVDEARAGFAGALSGDTTDLRVLFLAFQFHFRIGELDEAERLVRRRLAVIGPDVESADAARAYTNLGLIHHTRGDLDAAEAAMSKAVGIDERIGNLEGLARDLGNLGLVPETRGELDRAEELFRRSLAIAERIGAEKNIASMLANLGDVALRRDPARVAEAREGWARAIGIFERLGLAKQRDEFSKKLAGLDGAPSRGT